MRVNKPLRLTILATASAVVFFGGGCRSGMLGESAWKRPSLSGLAFWKKEDSAVPKPPAVHFDPTPAQSQTQLAAQNSKTMNSPADVKNSLDKLAKFEPLAEPRESTDPPVAAAQQPSRAPYTVSTPSDTVPSVESNLARSAQMTPPSPTSSPGASDASDFKPFSQAAENMGQTLNSVAKSADQARAQFKSDMQGLVVPSEISNHQLASLGGSLGQRGVEAKPPLSAEQQRLEAEVAKAQQEIAALKSQLANNPNRLAPIAGTSSGLKSNEGFQPPAASNANPALAPGASFNPQPYQPSGSAGFAPLRPNANLGSGALSPAGNQPNSRPPAAGQMASSDGATTASNGAYPATAHGGFAPMTQTGTAATNPDNYVKPVGLQAPWNATQPGLGTEKTPGAAVGDVDIPESVLRGSGSFSPGSVNRLRAN